MVFVPFLRAIAELLTALEDAEWRADHRTSNQWGAMVLLTRSRRIPLLQIINDLQRRINTSTVPILHNSVTSTALHLLQSLDLQRDLGLSSPLSASDSVSLTQLVPRIKCSFLRIKK